MSSLASASAALALAGPAYLLVPFYGWQDMGADGLGGIANALRLLQAFSIVGAVEGLSLILAQWCRIADSRLAVLGIAFACTGLGVLANAILLVHGALAGVFGGLGTLLPAFAALHILGFLLSLGGFTAGPALLEARTQRFPVGTSPTVAQD